MLRPFARRVYSSLRSHAHAPSICLFQATRPCMTVFDLQGLPSFLHQRAVRFSFSLLSTLYSYILHRIRGLKSTVLDLAKSNVLAHPRRRGKGRKARQEHVPSAWELVALVISIVSLLAIILIASTSHGQPATTLPLGITLNAAISICSTIMKTTMLYCAAEAISQSKWIWFHRQHQRLSDVELYDQASRGLGCSRHAVACPLEVRSNL